uniref:Glycosyl transferase 64 domain-containing protein n=1 Tax=Vitrella brassicaformis TaxID=1169539 RepID=A0A7S1K7U5_9ALVE|mmetsp:Transcript_41876/g.104543  ORF Transcript_41876/g.104543 Transcript_41876/m.104543 type:complete len:366 (+) Transcript_41876:46-1143(+)
MTKHVAVALLAGVVVTLLLVDYLRTHVKSTATTARARFLSETTLPPKHEVEAMDQQGGYDYAALQNATLDQWKPASGPCSPRSSLQRRTTFRRQTTLSLKKEDAASENLQGSVTAAITMGPFRAKHRVKHFLTPLEQCIYIKEIVFDTWVPADQSIVDFRAALGEQLMKANSTKARVLPGERGLGERFYVAEYIDSPFTLVLDDDRSMKCAEIHKLLLAGRLFPRRVVSGLDHRRSIYKCGSSDALFYSYSRNDDNLALTCGALLSTSLLQSYTQIIPKPVVGLINREKNCEDMTINWLAAHLNGDEQESCVIVEDASALVGPQGSESLSRTNTEARRDACVNFLRDVFPYWPVPRPSSFRVRIH